MGEPICTKSSSNNGMTLNFVAPCLVEGKPVVKLNAQEIENNAEGWKNAMVIYVVRDTPAYTYMENYIGRTWNKVTKPSLFFHDEGYFIAKFKDQNDRDDILYSGPYTMNNRQIVLRPWTSDYDFRREFLRIFPLWGEISQASIELLGEGFFE